MLTNFLCIWKMPDLVLLLKVLLMKPERAQAHILIYQNKLKL